MELKADICFSKLQYDECFMDSDVAVEREWSFHRELAR
jgi:hypothetical protein